MTTHSKLSPSARYRWGACPASVRMMENYPEGSRTSAAAIDGTHSHTLLENCIKHAEGCAATDPAAYNGLVLKDHDGTFGVDMARIERVRVATDYINNRVSELTQAGYVVEVIAEKRVKPDSLTGRNDLSGTIDIQLVTSDMVEIIDYKDGMNPVSAEGNEQLELYAVGVLAENMDAGFKRPLETVIMTIIQPKAVIKGGEAITSSTVPVTTFYTEVVPKVIAQAAATDAPDSAFIPGEKQCKYCHHTGNCKALTDWSLERAGIKFKDISVVTQSADKSAEVMTDAELRELIEAGPILRKVIEEAEAEALKRMSAGHPVAGLKVVRNAGRRAWALPEEEIAAKLSKMGVPKNTIWKTSVVTIANVMDTQGKGKLTWEKRDGTVMKLTDRQLKVVSEELATKSNGSLTVVSESDNRQGVNFADLQTVFKPVVPEAPAIPSWLS